MPPRASTGAQARDTPRPSRPNPHPLPLTPSRAPRGKTPRAREGLAFSPLAKACCVHYRPSPALYGQSGCGHFIKSPPLIYRLAHRQSAVRLAADTRGALAPFAGLALPLVDWGAAAAPLAPLLCAGLWRCLRRLRALICSLAVVALPSSSVCLSSSNWPGVLFGLVLLPRAYSRGLRPRPLALSASCRARVRAASGHAAIAALRRSGWVIICRLPRCAAAAPPRGFPPVQLPGVCPRGGPSDCPTDSDLIYRLPHRQITI